MPRTPRNSVGGVVYHALNRAAGRRRMFRTPGDYAAFMACLAEAAAAVPGCRVLAWCVMPNHWHLVLWPRRDGELSAFVRRLSQRHAQRHRHAHNAVGDGPLYQGRYKSFPAEQDEHFLMLCRYVERNALRAGLCRRAADWQWGSAWARSHGPADLRSLLSDWPVDRPRHWDALLNEPQPADQERLVETSLARGRPLGDTNWVARTAARLGLTHTLRPPGRPRKQPAAETPERGRPPKRGPQAPKRGRI